MTNLVNALAVVFGVLCIAFLISAGVAVRRRRRLRLVSNSVFAVLMLAVALVFGSVALGTRGYQALTHEEIAAVVRTEPVGDRRFRASFAFPDGRRAEFELAGDELYVDAHILKWKPIVNVIGLHTAYELDRVAGRYSRLRDEQDGLRTVHTLAEEKPIDLFDLRRRYAVLGPLFDAEYGSATFVAAGRAAEYEIRVSTSGLLARERR